MTKKISKSKGSRRKAAKNHKSRKSRVLKEVQIRYNKTREYLSVKLPVKVLISVVVLILLVALGALSLFPETPRGLELVESPSCDLSKIPEHNLEVYHKFEIQGTTTFTEFQSNFNKLKEKIPTLTKYYGPNLNSNTQKNGVGVHLTKYGVASFIIIWEKPFYQAYTIKTGYENSATAEQDGNVDYIHSQEVDNKLTTIWLFNEEGNIVCEQKL